MQIIGDIYEMIECKLDEAEQHIEKAFEWREEYPTLSMTLQKLSIEEMNHMNMLHDQIVALINEYKKDHGDPPERMMGIYDYLHKKYMKQANRIKALQSMYK